MAKKLSSLKSARQIRLRRILFVGAASLLLLAIVGVAAFYALQGWRARDLAAKAMSNFHDANYRMAWLQMNSARNLRPQDSKVLRTAATIEGGFGLPSAVEHWEQLAARGSLSGDDLAQWARAAATFGGEEQFQRAVGQLEAAGATSEAGRVRAARRLARGEMDRAIEEARRVIAYDDEPAMKLDLARLLLRRHVDRLVAAPDQDDVRRVADEMNAIVDSLIGTDVQDAALAFGLTFLLPGPEKQARWAALAMENPTADNVALLPAATVMIDLEQTSAPELHAQLRPIFDAAPLNRRAAFVAWLTRQEMPREALTLVTVGEAGESPQAFAARAGALTALANWTALVEMANAAANVPATMRLLTRARGEFSLRGDGQSGANSVAEALRAASREGNLAAVASAGDELGAAVVVDQTLIELSGDPAVAGPAFRLARDRFSRRGATGAVLLQDAHARAMVAAPQAVQVLDYTRYLNLLAAVQVALEAEDDAADVIPVLPEETAAALQADPADILLRATHALALLQAGRPAEALGTFDDFTVFYHRLPPGTQAVICAVLASNGQQDLARQLAAAIDRQHLVEQERLLLNML
jgi:tetratricopeptide (TPR) repeat protein